MKQIGILFLALLLLCGAVSACTGQTDLPETERNPVTDPVTIETETEMDYETQAVSETDPIPDAARAASLTVSRAFGDDMILQRDEPIRIWGWANESENGKRIDAAFAGLTGSCLVEDGRWLITLNGTLPASTDGGTLRVYGAEGAEKVFRHVLVGDVFWVAGQSNVGYSVRECTTVSPADDPGRTAEISDRLQIRLNRSCYWSDEPGLPRGTNDVNEDAVQPRGWEMPSRGAADFSALGYFTALQLYKALDREVPIGVIEFDGNGLPLHTFLPNEVRDSLGIATEEDGVYKAPGFNCDTCSFIYNHYMYAFRLMPIRGIIWYQGESDCQSDNGNNVKYAERFAAMIRRFRDVHDLRQHDYPVYYVEFPPIYIEFDFARVRQTMGSIPNLLTNAHVCVTSDLWKDRDFPNNLHPYNKWAISERLTATILADSYGIGDPEALESPTAVSCAFSADGLTAEIRFRNVGGGLTTYGGGPLKGIGVITGSDGAYVPAEAEIVGADTVRVTSPIPILAVGYNNRRDASYPEDMTLCSGSGLPAAAFRFDA